MPLVVADVTLGDPVQEQSGPSLWWSQIQWGIVTSVVRLLPGLCSSPSAVRAKTPVITYVVGDGCKCEEAAPGSLWLLWVDMCTRMCPWGIEPGNQHPPAGNQTLTSPGAVRAKVLVSICIFRGFIGAREIVHWLIKHTSIAENLNSIPSVS